MSYDWKEEMKKRGKQSKSKGETVVDKLSTTPRPTISKPKPGLPELHTKMDKVLGILESETYIDTKSNKYLAKRLLNNEILYRDQIRNLARFLKKTLTEKKIDLKVRTGGDMDLQKESVINALNELKNQNKFDSIF